MLHSQEKWQKSLLREGELLSTMWNVLVHRLPIFWQEKPSWQHRSGKWVIRTVDLICLLLIWPRTFSSGDCEYLMDTTSGLSQSFVSSRFLFYGQDLGQNKVCQGFLGFSSAVFLHCNYHSAFRGHTLREHFSIPIHLLPVHFLCKWMNEWIEESKFSLSPAPFVEKTALPI